MSALVGYYQALAAEANSKASVNAAQSGLVGNEANEVGSNAASARALQGANAYKTGQEAGQVAANAAAQRGLEGQQGSYYGANAKASGAPFDPANSPDNIRRLLFGRLPAETQSRFGHVEDAIAAEAGVQPTIPLSGTSSPSGSLFSSHQSILGDGYNDRFTNRQRNIDGHSTGTSRVPGGGSGAVDTVPAMLAPGEAVLNKGAAEHVGRGLIAKANKIGLAKMESAGTPAATTRGGLQSRPQKHAKGTANVKEDASGGSPMAYVEGSVKEMKGQANGVSVHQPSMVHGMQLMAQAMGMLPARQGLAKGTARVVGKKSSKNMTDAMMLTLSQQRRGTA